ncbi:class I SAM-dependent methyltransferase [Halosimplex pelagicum]|uniref:Methyltransferase domain-containing protein n=1 Tax=Halosimplex pelagicum TaxID=869886 RepID=A0A7D5P7P3_9EURY|nr:class I SAM-dependent methyltransferase [Halosimplex pelagicum]QLH82886.1 methyltransferase domain-containing protein [Halosimplex pelagicum]
MPIDEATRDAYETMAAENDDWSDEPLRRNLEWPATRSLLPDLDGLRVLEAGCGAGDYTEYFLEQGGEVVAVDATEAAVERVRERYADDLVTVRHADLTEPLDFLADESVDLVVSQLVLEHIADWRPVFEEFARVLRPDGRFVFSTGNPVSGWVTPDEAESYFQTEGLTQDWGEMQPRNYRRPLAEHLNPLADAGFAIERFLEPTPDPAFREVDPEKYERLTTVPRWECVRARLVD